MKKWDKHWARVSVILVALAGIILPIISHAATDSYPALTGRVVDEAHILSFTERTALENRLAQAEPHQVVAVSLASLRGQEIEEYGVALGRHWGIGRKDENDGVLIMIAPTERQMRIEVGYGLEGTLTDARASEIIRRIMLPLAKQGKYGEALIQGSNAVIGVLTGTAVPATPETQTDNEQAITGLLTNIVSVFLEYPFSFLGFLCLPIFIGLLINYFVDRWTKEEQLNISEKEIKKIIANCKVPITKQEKELSRQDRLCFFIIMIQLCFGLMEFIFIPISADIKSKSLDIVNCIGDTVVLLVVFLCLKHIHKMYKANPYFPLYELCKHFKRDKSGFSDSDSGSSGGSSFGGGSSFSGGGGSFGGGGSSGRW